MAAAQPPALFPAKLPLLRPKHGRWIAGVARGIGMHLGVHVAWVRLAFALSCFAYGAGAIAYVALWVLVPPGDPVAEAARRVRLAQSAGAANAPLSRGNTPYGTPRSPEPVPDNPYDYTGLNEETGSRPVSMESMRQVIDEASKPALFACAGVVLIAIALLINQLQTANGLMLPVLLAATGVGLPWLRFNARTGQTWTTVVGVLLVFAAYALLVTQTAIEDGSVPFLYSLCAGFALLAGVLCALVPQLVSLMRTSGRERALKEREEERADMAAHLHDGVLQTLALIQLHAAEPQQVFALARSQERELRSWLYQERTTSDRSVKAGLEEIAAQVEDTHGKPIDVVTVGDARPSRSRCIARPANARWRCLCATTARASTSTRSPRAAWGSVNRSWGVFVGVAARWRSCRARTGAPRCACTCRSWPAHPRHRRPRRPNRPPERRTMARPAAAHYDAARGRAWHGPGAAQRTNGGRMEDTTHTQARIAVVDDHEMFRAGVIATLQPYFDIVGQAADVESSIDMIVTTQPDVVLLDVHVPGGAGGGGAEILAKSHPHAPRTAFLALSVSDSAQDVGSVIRAGARGYVTKTITGHDLIDSIEQVSEGYAVFSPKLAGFVLSAFQGAPPDAPATDEPVHDEELDRLSAREQEVMRLIARGYTYKEVASELFISIKTVETHVSSVLRKLQLSNRNELTLWASDRHIV